MNKDFRAPQVKSITPIQVLSFYKRRYKAHFKTKSRLSVSCWKEFFAELFFDLIGVTFFVISKVFFRVEVWEVANGSVKLSHFIEGIESHLRNSNHRLSRKRTLRFIYWPLEYPNDFLGSCYEELVTNIFRSRYLKRCFLFLKRGNLKGINWRKAIVNRTNLEELRAFDAGSVSISFKDSHLESGAQLERHLFGSSGTDYVVFAYTSREYRKNIDGPDWPKDNFVEKLPNPETFKLMISNLRINGLGVVRMGLNLDDSSNLVEAGLVVPRLKESKSGFNDVWLSAHCKLLVTAHTGAFFFAEAFNKPWVGTDVHTFAYPNWSSRGTLIFCLCWNEEEQKFASFQWMKDNPRWCYDSARVGKLWKVVHNTPEQIVDVVTEKLARINGEWVDSVDDQELQKRFQRFVFGDVKDFSFLPRAGTKFLREHQHLLPD
jgi:putative glycosyltransferase (TIGR04372 family)